MAIREVLRMGDSRLLQPASPVEEFDTPALHTLIRDLRDTMLYLDGAGLAAPQIGVGLQVVIFEVMQNPRYPEAAPIPFTVLINPEVIPLSDEQVEGWEGCLSLPGLRGRAQRFSQVCYRARDAKGGWIERTVDGFHARVVQHETDHLKGILYPMRMTDMRAFGFTDVLFPDLVGRE